VKIGANVVAIEGVVIQMPVLAYGISGMKEGQYNGLVIPLAILTNPKAQIRGAA
jgi:hypothetical protein